MNNGFSNQIPIDAQEKFNKMLGLLTSHEKRFIIEWTKLAKVKSEPPKFDVEIHGYFDDNGRIVPDENRMTILKKCVLNYDSCKRSGDGYEYEVTMKIKPSDED